MALCMILLFPSIGGPDLLRLLSAQDLDFLDGFSDSRYKMHIGTNFQNLVKCLCLFTAYTSLPHFEHVS